MRRFLALASLLFAATAAHAQWELQDSHVTADLRGIDFVGNGVAWASGTNGTVLRTEDQGFVWQLCTTPPGAEHLDFRGIQAFDNNTAIVMSSGKGDQSRLYKTTDGCATWTLVFTNPDKDGFWDALVFGSSAGELVGDPVQDRFFVADQFSRDFFRKRIEPSAPKARPGEAIFAASNSAVLSFDPGQYMIGTGGSAGARVLFSQDVPDRPGGDVVHTEQWSANVPVGAKRESAGIFSLASSTRQSIVAVGGDYLKPEQILATAAFTEDGGLHWIAAATPPHGYRSAVAYDKSHNTWITVGPNGTDISTDDGRNWRALKPDAKSDDAPDADQHWNALSLPFVVGPHGRIGILRDNALTPKPAFTPK